jgi:hypothetical protein
MQESRQLEIARTIERDEPLYEECETPSDKLYKAHCVLLDVLGRDHRGIELDGDWENLCCITEAARLLGEVLSALSLDKVDVSGRGIEIADAAQGLRDALGAVE